MRLVERSPEPTEPLVSDESVPVPRGLIIKHKADGPGQVVRPQNHVLPEPLRIVIPLPSIVNDVPQLVDHPGIERGQFVRHFARPAQVLKVLVRDPRRIRALLVQSGRSCVRQFLNQDGQLIESGVWGRRSEGGGIAIPASLESIIGQIQNDRVPVKWLGT